jgi:hypothetical protein
LAEDRDVFFGLGAVNTCQFEVAKARRPSGETWKELAELDRSVRRVKSEGLNRGHLQEAVPKVRIVQNGDISPMKGQLD